MWPEDEGFVPTEPFLASHPSPIPSLTALDLNDGWSYLFEKGHKHPLLFLLLLFSPLPTSPISLFTTIYVSAFCTLFVCFFAWEFVPGFHSIGYVCLSLPTSIPFPSDDPSSSSSFPNFLLLLTVDVGLLPDSTGAAPAPTLLHRLCPSPKDRQPPAFRLRPPSLLFAFRQWHRHIGVTKDIFGAEESEG